MRTFLFILTGIVLIAGVVIALKTPETAPVQTSELTLTSYPWLWKHTKFANGNFMTPEKPGAFTVTFTIDGTVSGTTDCNSWGSTYTTSGETIRIKSMVSTQKYCETSQETAYFSQIGGADKFSFNAKGNLVIEIEIDSVGTVATMTYMPAGVQAVDDWLDSTDGATTFRYPENLGTKYVSTVDWPPKFTTTNEPHVCTSGGAEVERAGATREVMVNESTYCETTVVEGAAGSTYTQYAYARPAGGTETQIMTFTLRAPNCGNYDEPERSVCQSEHDTFDLLPVVDKIFKSVRY